MKKIFSLLVILLFALTAFAQKDVTKFLGIPVDGSKSDMIQKLKDKGFKPSSLNKDILEGEFNGRDVYVSVVTNGNKVYRVFVQDAHPSSETGIKIRFNNLCQQFNKNDKYLSIGDYTISDDEDISTQMNLYSKRYDAVFYQAPKDTLYIDELLNSKLKKLYTPEQLENPTDEIEENKQKILLEILEEIIQNKVVWFMISKDRYNEYSILMYYDNKYNQADGEDL